jgi:hypothetical protein
MKCNTEVDKYIEILTRNNVPFFVCPIGEYIELGASGKSSTIIYPIRRLEFGDKVVLERVEQYDDETELVSYMYPTGHEPFEWLPVIDVEVIELTDLA